MAVIGAAAVGWTSGSLVEEQPISVTSKTRNNATDFNVIYRIYQPREVAGIMTRFSKGR